MTDVSESQSAAAQAALREEGEDKICTDQPLHVFDLPQLYQKPSCSQLFEALELLNLNPSKHATSFTTSFYLFNNPRRLLSDGVERYLTNIIASSLSWFENEQDRERVWELASQCLTARSGRSAQGDMIRTFPVKTGRSGNEEGKIIKNEEHDRERAIEVVTISLEEPALTGDNLGFKTWASSYVMAEKLSMLLQVEWSILEPVWCARMGQQITGDEQSTSGAPRYPYCLPPDLVKIFEDNKKHEGWMDVDLEGHIILELGAGTGLVGIAAAAILHNHYKRSWVPNQRAELILTDLPEIVPNLAKNVERNKILFQDTEGTLNSVVVKTGILDWTHPGELFIYADGSGQSQAVSQTDESVQKFPTVVFPAGKAHMILIADPIYSSNHPSLLAKTIEAHLVPKDCKCAREARVIIAFPKREPYREQQTELWHLLQKLGLEMTQTYEEITRDDWADDVSVCICVWMWRQFNNLAHGGATK